MHWGSVLTLSLYFLLDLLQCLRRQSLSFSSWKVINPNYNLNGQLLVSRLDNPERRLLVLLLSFPLLLRSQYLWKSFLTVHYFCALCLYMVVCYYVALIQICRLHEGRHYAHSYPWAVVTYLEHCLAHSSYSKYIMWVHQHYCASICVALEIYTVSYIILCIACHLNTYCFLTDIYYYLNQGLTTFFWRAR